MVKDFKAREYRENEMKGVKEYHSYIRELESRKQ